MVLRAPLRGGTVAKSGYLIKAPRSSHLFSRPRRRFILLSECKLEWFVDDQPFRQPEGSIPLAGARIEERTTTGILTIFSESERVVLRGDKLDEWEAAIRVELEKLDEEERHLEALQTAIVQLTEQAEQPAAMLQVREDEEAAVDQVMSVQDRMRPGSSESKLPGSNQSEEAVEEASPSADASATPSLLRENSLSAEMHERLSAFDRPLVKALDEAVIRVASVAWLLAQSDDFTMPYRQQLEELERGGASPSPLLSPKEAAALVQQGDRSLGAVTHAWLCPGNPDPQGRRMKVLRKALKALPHIKGLFFECAMCT